MADFNIGPDEKRGINNLFGGMAVLLDLYSPEIILGPIGASVIVFS